MSWEGPARSWEGSWRVMGGSLEAPGRVLGAPVQVHKIEITSVSRLQMSMYADRPCGRKNVRCRRPTVNAIQM